MKREKNKQKTQQTILYPWRLSFRTEDKIKNFPDKQKLKECITTELVLQEMLK